MSEVKIPEAAIRSAAQLAKKVAAKSKHCGAVADCAHCNLSFLAIWAEDLLTDVATLTRELSAANAKRGELERANQRLMDLVRYQRHELFNANLISEKEYAELVYDSEKGERVARLESYDTIRAELSAARETIARLESAIEWALGYTDFAPRAEGQGAYWWRKELRDRSGFTFQQDKGRGKMFSQEELLLMAKGDSEWAEIEDVARAARELLALRAKRRFGWGRDNLCRGCAACHELSHMKGIRIP